MASPDDAIRRAGIVAAPQSLRSDYISNLFNTLRASLGLGGKLFQPTRMQAVYVPSWILYARGSANVRFPEGDSQTDAQRTLEVHFNNSYVDVVEVYGHPCSQITVDICQARYTTFIYITSSSKGFTGFSMDPLSRMVFSVTDEEHLELAETFDPEMTKQQGLDVLCLPYTSTPFALPDVARSLSFQDGAVGDVRFDPPSVKTEMVRDIYAIHRTCLQD